MVRTKKQIIDSLAIKNNKQDDANTTRLDHSTIVMDDTTVTMPMISEFYAPNVPTSPLPTLVMDQEKSKEAFPSNGISYIPTIPAIKSTPYFEPPYVMNNFWPPPPSPQQKILSSNGKKLEAMFSNLNPEEINEMMIDCGGSEDEAILRLITQTGYLEYIRHRLPSQVSTINKIKQNTAPPPSSSPYPNLEQTSAPRAPPVYAINFPPPPQQMVQPNYNPVHEETPIYKPINSHSTPSPLHSPIASTAHLQNSTTSPIQQQQHKTHKKHSRSSKSNNNSGGCRLALDDALQQIQDSEQNGGYTDGYAGWSAARLRAFKMIDKNPNSYYYRFNAPGEQQKKGKWTEEETALFLNRLRQVGANSQWGIFSIAIPGRVGYQCSNYYRFMIEMGQLHDPNYVLDEKGKARYLFDKKTEDGAVEKIFRKHSKHGSVPLHEANNLLKEPVRKRKQSNISRKRDEEDSDDDDPTFNIKKSANSNKKKTSKRTKSSPSTTGSSNRRVTRQSMQHQEEGEDDDDEINDDKGHQTDHVVPN